MGIDKEDNLNKRLTKEILHDMVVNQNMTDSEIANEFNCNRSAVIYYRNKYGIPTSSINGNLQQVLNKETISDLYLNQHMTDTQIAHHLGCHPRTVTRYRKKYGIKSYNIQDSLTEETLKDLYINYKMTDIEIASKFQCDQSTVSDYRAKYHIQTLVRETELQQKLTKDVLVELYVNQHMTDHQIAQKFNCSAATVTNYRIKYGISGIAKEVSDQQQEVYDMICGLFLGANKEIPEIVMNNRTLLGSLEIDILLPSYNLGVEFNGGFWHSDVIHDKMYHYNKSALAQRKGIFIYHIFSYEWADLLKREKIKHQLQNLLGLNMNKIYAHKCEIHTVVPADKRTFLNTNHIQGNDSSSIQLGLYYNNDLVSIMTFTKSKLGKNYAWKLSRFCSKAGYNVIDGASKLFKHFIDNYLNKNEVIVSYSDIAKTKSDLYEKLGFTFLHDAKPKYVWWKQDYDYKTRCKMINEIQIMQSQGYNRIYNCGNKVWIYKKETRN